MIACLGAWSSVGRVATAKAQATAVPESGRVQIDVRASHLLAPFEFLLAAVGDRDAHPACSAMFDTVIWPSTVRLFSFYEQDRLLRGMDAIEPVFERVLWAPYRVALDSQAVALRAYVAREALDRRLAQLATFYGSA